MIAGFFARGMPPGVLEPQAGGSIAVPGSKDKKTGPEIARTARRLTLAGRTLAGLGGEPGFEGCDPRLQRLVLLARQPRHLLDRLELLALD
jgi:hypothetical protein